MNSLFGPWAGPVQIILVVAFAMQACVACGAMMILTWTVAHMLKSASSPEQTERLAGLLVACITSCLGRGRMVRAVHEAMESMKQAKARVKAAKPLP